MTALDNRHKLKSFKGVTKLYLTHCSCVAIILFNRGLYKSLFSTYPFGKLVFCLFAIFVFSACSEFDLILINFFNVCIIIIYIVGVRYCVFVLPYHFSIRQFVRTDTRHKNLITALN